MNNHKQDQGDVCPSKLKFVAICFANSRSKTLCTILLATILIASAVPLVSMYVIYPSFTNVIVKGIEKDAERLAKHILPPSLKHASLTSETLTPRFYGDIFKLEIQFGLMKVLVYSPTGEILYSTNPAEIGSLNTKPFFMNEVAKGSPYTKLITKNSESLEGQIIRTDVVETYVPLMRKKQFLGAFEMYYDITQRKSRLDELTLYSGFGMVFLSLCLIMTVVILLRKEASYQLTEIQTKKLKEEVERITQHDLKSPIVGVISGLEYLENFTETTEEQQSIMLDMRASANAAMNTINRSLDLYKMETGKYNYHPTDMDLLAVVRQAQNDLSGFAVSHGVEILTTCAGMLPRGGDTIQIAAEETLCYSLVANLLKNAIEASSDGDQVTITLSKNGETRLAIHNSGVVPEAIRDVFFEKYVTAGKTTGTGIGTYSARLMTRTMGGTIHMTTSETGGTIITVLFPLSKQNTKA